jgi:aryl-alcohol dehydrogenase-like predicted oxidoreductase
VQYLSLEVSGLKVSPLCLGSMTFGAATDQPTAAGIVSKAPEQGVNFLETGNSYCNRTDDGGMSID